MAKYKLESGRLFGEVESDDVDDLEFLKHPKQGSKGYMFDGQDVAFPDQGTGDPIKHGQQQYVEEEMDRISRRTLDSSRRCITLVDESEQIGIATAEELMHQREQLENCEAKVTDVNRSLRMSQKHINSIKSIFGGLVNKFSRTSDTTTPVMNKQPASEFSAVHGESRLSKQVDGVKAQQPLREERHPALLLRDVDYSLPSQAEIDRNPFASPTKMSSSHIEQQLDSNFDVLGSGLSRLKGLAIGLGEEIEEQNSLLERLDTSVERASLGIDRQNVQMKKILHK